GHLGGTFVETPARIGPFQASDGDLHVILEPTETDNAMMVVASDDGGVTWREADGPNRPAADDLEGVGAALLDGTIHVLHQTSDAVWHHAFDTADAASGTAGWSQTDVLVAEPGEPPTQTAALVARPDGTLVGVYGAPTNLRLKTWSPEAGWGEEQAIGAPAPSLSGVQAVLGAGGEVHIAFTGSDGTAWLRRLRPDGTLTEPQRLASDLGTAEADAGTIAPLVFVPETEEAAVLYRTADGVLTERRVRADGSLTPPEAVSERDVAQSPIDSEQVAADAVAHGGAVHVLFVQEQTGRLYRASRPAGGAWGSEEVAQAGANVQWVRGAVVRRADGSVVYGYVYDAGSNGGTGMNRYGEIVLQEP
ncbi:MAG: exo-alpha-sialidase, partial [Bacteroidota bacterium]